MGQNAHRDHPIVAEILTIAGVFDDLPRQAVGLGSRHADLNRGNCSELSAQYGVINAPESVVNISQGYCPGQVAAVPLVARSHVYNEGLALQNGDVRRPMVRQRWALTQR